MCTLLEKLDVSCLDEHKQFLEEELEPLCICDILFEESAINILDHDKATETSRRKKQISHLLDTIKKNENNCFMFFLYILQNQRRHHIIKELLKASSKETIAAGMSLSKYSFCILLDWTHIVSQLKPFINVIFVLDLTGQKWTLSHRINRQHGKFGLKLNRYDI